MKRKNARLEMRIEKTNGLPKFFQLKKIITSDIADGRYPVGTKLPTERSMMKMYGVSSITVARAMRELVAEGVVTRRVGDGSYVAESQLTRKSPLTSFGKASPRILVCSVTKNVSRSLDPCNWFIEDQIRSGLVNNLSFPVSFADFAELPEPDENCAAAVLINPTEPALRRFDELKFPRVIVDQAGLFEPDAHTVKWSQSSAIFELISHFLDCGHRRIGLIAGDSREHKERLSCYKVALETLGASYNGELVVTTDNGSDLGGYKAMRTLLAASPRPTAVFVDTDLKAAGALKAVEDIGLRVPDDISVAGFDDMPGSDGLTPPLTTIKAPYYEMGMAAARLAEKILKKDSELERAVPTILTSRLLMRGSTAKRASMSGIRAV
jgi:DNA-binding transcriptional regulator YhcF (GntR family)